MTPSPFDDAACVSSEVDFFSYDSSEIQQAKAICYECPIRRICLEKGLEEEHVFGVWGGVSQEELRRVRSVDINNNRTDYEDSPVRCPWCGPFSTKFLDVVRRKRTGTDLWCNNCNLEFHTKRAINKKKRNF